MPTRINKYLSEAGYCSRRKADRLIAKSYWLINSNSSEVKRFMKNDKSIDEFLNICL